MYRITPEEANGVSFSYLNCQPIGTHNVPTIPVIGKLKARGSEMPETLCKSQVDFMSFKNQTKSKPLSATRRDDEARLSHILITQYSTMDK